jgi:hypothetical protein
VLDLDHLERRADVLQNHGSLENAWPV